MKATGFDLRRTYAGQWEMVVTLDPSSVTEAMRFVDNARTRKQGTLFEILCRVFRKKRSADANAYCWVLCQKLAEKLSENDPKMTKDEVYRLAISKVGIFKDFCGIAESDAKTLRHAWEMLGTGWITEQVDYSPDGDAVTVRCYYGSSTYNTKQMSRLIDYLVEDCKELGIETLPPDELRRLYAQVDALHGNPESR